MKICNKCDINKELNEYEEGRNTCRDCRRESRKIHNKICGNCHRTFHMRYGYKNNNKQQLNGFIDKAL